jgi:DnaJ-class molecular chaperone
VKNAPTATEYLAMSKAQQLEARAAHGHRWYIQLTRSPEFREALRAGRPSPAARRAPSRAAVKRTVDRMVSEVINSTTESARPEAARRAEARALARHRSEPCSVCGGTGVYGFSDCGQCALLGRR